MFLTDEELKKMVFGYVRTEKKENGYLAFYRLTEEQVALHGSKKHLNQARASAGIYLEVVGEIKRISFSYEVLPGSSRPFHSFDVLENGVRKGGRFRELAEQCSTFSYEPFHPGTLTLYFPNLSEFALKDVEIEGNYRIVPRKRRLFVAGDSISQGYDTHTPSRSYANLLAWRMNAICLNQAVGGDVYDVRNFDAMPDFTPDLGIIAFGTNDWSCRKDVRTNADLYLKRFSELYPGVPAYVVTPIWRIDEGVVREETGLTVGDVRDIIRETALRYGFRPVDGLPLVPNDPAWYADGELHPNDPGHICYAQGLTNILRGEHPEFFD